MRAISTVVVLALASLASVACVPSELMIDPSPPHCPRGVTKVKHL